MKKKEEAVTIQWNLFEIHFYYGLTCLIVWYLIILIPTLLLPRPYSNLILKKIIKTGNISMAMKKVRKYKKELKNKKIQKKRYKLT